MAPKGRSQSVTSAPRTRSQSVSREPRFPPPNELRDMAQQREAQAAEVQADTAADQDRLELRISRSITKSLGKSKASVADLVRSWDANGDGEIQKIELRQVVRNKLKIKASNEEIDAIFDRLDTDGGGSLDMKEVSSAMALFKSWCRRADEETEAARAAAEVLRAEAATFVEAATSIESLHETQAKLGALRAGTWDGEAVLRLAVALNVKTKPKTAGDVAAVLGGDGKEGVMTLEAFCGKAMRLVGGGAGGGGADDAEAAWRALYHWLQESTSTAPLKAKDAARIVWEKCEWARLEEERLAKLDAEQGRASKRLMQLARDAMGAAATRDAEAAERAQAAKDEEAAATAAEAEAKAAEKAAHAAAKAQEKARFEQKVARRRSTDLGTTNAIGNNAIGNNGARGVPQGASKDDQMRAKFASLEKRYGKAMTPKEKRLRKAFALFDADGDGHITAEELAAILIRPGGANTFTMAQVEELLNDFDANGDGVLQFDEFSPLWEQVAGNNEAAFFGELSA